MKKILVFCSNPVDGGTAQVFSEMCKEIIERKNKLEIVPAVNISNSVKIYKSIPGLIYLEVFSEEDIVGKLELNITFFKRIINRVKRNILYFNQKQKNIKIMRTFLEREKFDCVLIHNGSYAGDELCNQLLKASKLANIRERIIVFHNDFEKSFFYKLVYKRYDSMINRCSTQIVTVSEYTKNRILSNSYLEKKIKVIYNGITFKNKESLEKKKEKLKYRDNIFHIGMVGNFLDNKGQLELLKAIKELNVNKNIKFQVFLIGNVYDKNYYLKCKDFIQENNLEKIISFHHEIYNANEYYELFDITIVPSLKDESFGLICIESMRAGVPIVAFKCGGIPEVIIDKEDGYLLEVGDIASLSRVILNLINNKKLCKKLGENAKKNYKAKFSRKKMGDKYIELLKGTI